MAPAIPAGAAPPRVADQPPTVVAYLALLQGAITHLGRGDATAAGADVAAAQRLLPPGGDALDDVIADLSSRPPLTDAASTRLREIVAFLRVPAGAAPGDAQAAQSALDRVYSRAPLSDLDKAPTSSSLFSRIADAFLQLFRGARDALGPVGSLLVGLLVAGVVAVLIWLLLRRAGASRVRRIVAEPAQAGDDPEEEWRAALAAAAVEEYREAVRRAFRSALVAVAIAGRLPVDAAWTSRELLARAQGDADLLGLLAPAATLFDRAWYSGHPVTEEDWDVARARCAAIRTLAGRRSAVRS
jgi:hypothetical protein